MKKQWEVLEKNKGKLDLELSVIRIDNQFGHISFGWGGVDKIILFGEENQLNVDENDEFDKKELAFARKCAKILCDGLNRT